MIKARYESYILDFINPSGTSRGILRQKQTFFLHLEENDKFGIGECGLFRGLSYDDRPDYEKKLDWVCKNINLGLSQLLIETREYPSIQIGLEMAFLSIASSNPYVLYPSAFTKGQDKIKINGLIWMGEKSFMKEQIKSKIQQGFSCVKLKIGAIEFQQELDLLRYIRCEFSENDIELRVDANGAFSPHDALEKLRKLQNFHLHSIEQPIRQGQWENMAKLCEQTPLPIALDEELIGIVDVTKRQELLQTIKPQYIILKPTLVGGFQQSQNWIELAENESINYWLTSALESNIGLNAIAQFTYQLGLEMPQGLGTGSLYANNINSPLKVKGEFLTYHPYIDWGNINNN